MYIETINSPEDVKKLTIEELPALAEEMRNALLIRASRHGGHFGPNFGMVEATIAMHYVFESPKDKIVYDVSHQSYPHKMLTGRKDAYLYEEHYDDVSGYTNPHESEHDFFTIGHTSTSVSLACGLAKARDLKGEDGNVIEFLNLNKDKNIRVEYIGDRTYKTTMSPTDRQAAAGVYELAQILSAMEQIKKEQEEANLKIGFINKKKERKAQEEITD